MERLADKYSGKRVMVTGGMGFVGSNLARYLVELGARVLVVDSLLPGCGGNPYNIDSIKDEVEVSSTDLRDIEGMARLVKAQ
ncbi:MAG: GDP-mannose 4,6-dehydratase, partial [Chloroflexota bacterium]